MDISAVLVWGAASFYLGGGELGEVGSRLRGVRAVGDFDFLSKYTFTVQALQLIKLQNGT